LTTLLIEPASGVASRSPHYDCSLSRANSLSHPLQLSRQKLEAASSLKFTRESKPWGSWILLFNRVWECL